MLDRYAQALQPLDTPGGYDDFVFCNGGRCRLDGEEAGKEDQGREPNTRTTRKPTLSIPGFVSLKVWR